MKPGIGRGALGHRAVPRRLWVAAIEARRPAPHHQPRRVELGRHVGELEPQCLEIGEWLAELPPLEQMVTCGFEAGARATQRAGGYIHAAALEPHPRDLEAVALLAQPVGDREAAILENPPRRRLGGPA